MFTVEPDLYIAFVLATTALILTPGPIVTLTIANSLAYGTRHGLKTVFGTSTATGLMLTVGGFGMVSVFSFLAEWLEYLRWGGAAYLVWLGVQQWREKAVDLNEAKLHAGPKKSLFWQGFLVSVTNPKTIFFYAAFFPQFMNMNADATSQLALLSVTFLIIATTLDSGFALLSGKLRHVLTGEHRGKISSKITGSILVSVGLAMVLFWKS